jgi:hypothetical protein
MLVSGFSPDRPRSAFPGSCACSGLQQQVPAPLTTPVGRCQQDAWAADTEDRTGALAAGGLPGMPGWLWLVPGNLPEDQE